MFLVRSIGFVKAFQAASMRTKSDVLRFAIAFALIKVRVAPFKLGLSESQRYEVADNAVRRILETGQWKELNDHIGVIDPPPSKVPGPYSK
jgi:hypothetical protein